MSLSPRPEQPIRMRASGMGRGIAARAEERVRSFDRGQDAFGPRAFGERIERLVVGRGFVVRPGRSCIR